MKSILIDASGGKGWIGGLYYKKNILFLLTQNEEISKNFKIIIVTEPSNKEVFSVFSCFKALYRSFAHSKSKHLYLALLILRYNCKYIFPASSGFYKLLGAEPIQWIPDFQYIHYPDLFGEETVSINKKYHRYLAKRSCKMILSSHDCAMDYYVNYKPDLNSVYVVPFVSYIEHEVRHIRQEEKRILSKYGLKAETYVCVSNQFWQHKNHIIVLKAMKILYSKEKSFGLNFVFTGQMEERRNADYIRHIKLMFENEIVKHHSIVLGVIEREEQLALMKNAKFIIQPSLFEGWGTVLEDAKVLDKTVLLSDIPVHREQMYDKCVLFDPYDAEELARLIIIENAKFHHDDFEIGIKDMYIRAKQYSRGLQKLLCG